jgi:hypothetical protein
MLDWEKLRNQLDNAGPIPDEEGGVMGHGSAKGLAAPASSYPKRQSKLRRSAGFGPDRREQRREQRPQSPSFVKGFIVDLGSKSAALPRRKFLSNRMQMPE